MAVELMSFLLQFFFYFGVIINLAIKSNVQAAKGFGLTSAGS
jgi:hypothetical protein